MALGKALRSITPGLGQALRWLTRSAAATTVTFAVGVAVVIVVLQIAWTSAGADSDFTSTFEFGLWVGLCGTTAGVWTVAFVLGWKEAAAMLPKDPRKARRRCGWGVVAVAALGGAAGLVMLLVGGETGFKPDVPGWSVWNKVIPGAGIAAAGPWVLTTWWTHDSLTRMRVSLDVTPFSKAKAKTVFKALRTTWPRVEGCTLAMVAIVTSGVLTTGALRVALVAGGAKDVPGEQQVLAYGLFFAVLVALVVVPLLLAYRRRARQYITVRYPATDPPGDAYPDRVVQVEELLYLSRGPFRDPWALLGVLTPAVAGALAAYLPGVSG